MTLTSNLVVISPGWIFLQRLEIFVCSVCGLLQIILIVYPSCYNNVYLSFLNLKGANTNFYFLQKISLADMETALVRNLTDHMGNNLLHIVCRQVNCHHFCMPLSHSSVAYVPFMTTWATTFFTLSADRWIFIIFTSSSTSPDIYMWNHVYIHL